MRFLLWCLAVLPSILNAATIPVLDSPEHIFPSHLPATSPESPSSTSEAFKSCLKTFFKTFRKSKNKLNISMDTPLQHEHNTRQGGLSSLPDHHNVASEDLIPPETQQNHQSQAVEIVTEALRPMTISNSVDHESDMLVQIDRTSAQSAPSRPNSNTTNTKKLYIPIEMISENEPMNNVEMETAGKAHTPTPLRITDPNEILGYPMPAILHKEIEKTLEELYYPTYRNGAKNVAQRILKSNELKGVVKSSSYQTRSMRSKLKGKSRLSKSQLMSAQNDEEDIIAVL